MILSAARRRVAAVLLLLVGAISGLATLAPAADAEYLGARMPYAAFDRLKATRIKIGESVIDVAFAPGNLTLTEAQVLDWVASSARIVAGYYGRFPAPRTRLLIVPGNGTNIHGTTFAYRGAAIRFILGEDVAMERTTRDWVLIHEMAHLALPEVSSRQHWIEEGLASYVEPIARAQAGQLNVDDVWLGFVRGMPQGLPRSGDQGLDNTPTWGRTYWGGALFCLLAEVEMRNRTANRYGLQHALRAILAKGGGMEETLPIEQIFRIGDAAVGVPVLSELYAKMKDQPGDVDLDNLWQRLGVEVDGRTVRYNDDAPMAAIRRAMTAPIGATS